MKIELIKTVFVFDLDDTLYKERDYYLSGVQAVSEKIMDLYSFDASAYLKAQVDAGTPDLWGSLCEKFKLSESVKHSIIWLYRLHQPSIQLDYQVKSLLVWLENNSPAVAILTDGRSITQRLKAVALGVNHLPLYISEDYGASKPDPLRFEMIQEKYTGYDFVYIGDNPAKDFLAPKRLGWKTIGIMGCSKNIHSQDTSRLDDEFLPDLWLTDIKELEKYIF